MTTEDYRTLLLERLIARDKLCSQFSRIFNSYDALTESFDRLVSKGGKRANANSPSIDDASTKLDAAKVELAELYKRKAINDQALIDANLKLASLHARLTVVENEKEDARKQSETLRRRIAASKTRIDELKTLNLSLKANFDETLEEYRRVDELYMIADQERVSLIDEIKRMKECQIAMLNEQNEFAEKQRIERIRTELAEAVRTHQPVTKKLIKLADNLHGALAADAAGASDESASSIEHIGYDIPTRCTIKLDVDESGDVMDCIFHPNGWHFFTCGGDKTVKMLDLNGNLITKKCVFQGANQGITRLALDAESGLLAASSTDKSVRLWNIIDRRLKTTFTGHTDKVVSARFTNSARTIASGSVDRTIKLFDIATSRCVYTYLPASMVLDLTTNDRFGAPVISSHFDRSIRFYDLRVSEPTNQIKCTGKIASLFVGYNLLCTSRDETLFLFDIRNNSIIHTYSAEQYQTASDYCKSVISPGGIYIAAGSADGQLFIWNTITTKLEKILYKGGHEAPILSLAWHPRGHMLISGDKRKTLCSWT